VLFIYLTYLTATSDLTAPDVWMIGGKGMGKYVEGSGCGVI